MWLFLNSTGAAHALPGIGVSTTNKSENLVELGWCHQDIPCRRTGNARSMDRTLCIGNPSSTNMTSLFQDGPSDAKSVPVLKYVKTYKSPESAPFCVILLLVWLCTLVFTRFTVEALKILRNGNISVFTSCRLDINFFKLAISAFFADNPGVEINFENERPIKRKHKKQLISIKIACKGKVRVHIRLFQTGSLYTQPLISPPC